VPRQPPSQSDALARHLSDFLHLLTSRELVALGMLAAIEIKS
jgi:hypothetical protein